MQTKEDRRHIASNVWSARIIPIVLLGVIAYASYVTIGPLCVEYVLAQHHAVGTVAAILVMHIILLILMLSSFLRLLQVTVLDPPLLPLGPKAVQDRQSAGQRHRKHTDEGTTGSEYKAERDSGISSNMVVEQSDPDSSGLELFYTKDIFVCQLDGKPNFCSECNNWKPDRAHHCSMNGCCILKMDHFCPWVGGPLGENNIKYFIQFNGYTALFCAELLVIMAFYMVKQRNEKGGEINVQFSVIMGLAAMFGLFTSGMFGVTFYGALKNVTQVENLSAKAITPRIHTLAVLKPSYEEVIRVNPDWDSNPSYKFNEVTYPLPRPREVNVDQAIVSQGPEDAGNRNLVRDQLATRTFAIIQLRAGDNPWDLGSMYLNLQTVLGTNIIDWFLPFNRSPCCIHDDTRSQFEFGPAVDLAVATLFFKEASDPDMTWEDYPRAMQKFLKSARRTRSGRSQGTDRKRRSRRREAEDMEEGLSYAHRMEDLPVQRDKSRSWAMSMNPFQASSALSGGIRKKSKFTYRNLAHLAALSTTCPLRVIAHVDLDAFYAQCEQVRLGIAADQPLAVQQWYISTSLNVVINLTCVRDGLIAINYPSRKFGLTRMITPTEAKKLCPHIILQHVATWKEGDAKWAYHDDVAKNIATHKVSLDPYRLESRRILACIREALPASLQKIEKAGIDEFFLDLSAQVHSILLERYQELRGPAPYDDPTECLPFPDCKLLDWQADALVDLDAEQAEEVDPDWDDFAMLIGSEIVRNVRATVWDKLKYTVSGGIAQNKMLAKLGSAYKKPDQQTVVRNRAVQQFLSDFKFTKIRGLGGKLGDQISSTFNTEMLKDLLPVPVELLKQKLGDDTGTWVYQVIRGIESSEVNARTLIKSMLSAKSFRPSINSEEHALRWIRIFSADVFTRLVEEGVIENKRRPKTLNLQHRHDGQVSARSTPIPQGRKLDEASLFELARSLLRQMIAEGNVWPCGSISMSVSGFEEGVTGNMGISSFLVRGEQAKALNNVRDMPSDRPYQRRKLEASTDIQSFFARCDTGGEHDNTSDDQALGREESVFEGYDARSTPDPVNVTISPAPLHQRNITNYVCEQCNKFHKTADNLQSHLDWHFAKDLQDEERAGARPSMKTNSSSKTPTQSANKKKNGRGKPEKGQMKLAFG
ncbi:hypothetical protein BJ878DRAFT_483719 [Calycina marina]|uniref:DNA polymerase eta n=1 Tax=Calycina marina TaxID=1763456 RepID=A0A9P8CB42_9HELO|nr:hypothetical protein BJ878DRAFT_483719 [Calycina marina]